MSHSPTLRDVARYAGVSLGTASRALNNKHNILPETRSLVLRAASELGYKLQFRVASSVSSKLNTIGVVIKRDPYNSKHIDVFNYGILGGIEDECQRLGLNVMFSTIPVDIYSHAIDTSPVLQESSVDGLLMVGIILEDEQVYKYLPQDKPIVFVDGCSTHGEYDCVVIDNYSSACQAVSHLIEQGHQHIALIGSAVKDNEHPSFKERRLGYLQTLAKFGIIQTYMLATTMDLREIKDATRQLLQEHPEVTAIFACNDLIATEIIPVIHESGLGVPHNISIIGFDDVELAAKSTPALTTMHVDRALLGALAVRRLYDRAAHLDGVPVKTTIGTRLIRRQSVSSNSRLSNGHHGES